MFEKVNVPILGIVENMSYFTAPGGERVEIFGHGGGTSGSEPPKCSFSGGGAFIYRIREGGDKGRAGCRFSAKIRPGKVFIEIAADLRNRLP